MTMTCPDCGHQLQIAKSKSGQRAKCLECSKVFRISPKRTARPPKALANDSSPESSEDEPSFDFAGLAELESQCPSIPQSEPSEFSPQRGPRRGPRRKGGDPAEQKAPKRRAQSTWFRDSVGIVLSVLDAVREFLSTVA